MPMKVLNSDPYYRMFNKTLLNNIVSFRHIVMLVCSIGNNYQKHSVFFHFAHFAVPCIAIGAP